MKKILIIGFVWPEPKTTAAGHRMVQLIEAFLDFGWSVTFASSASQTEYSLNLDDLRVDRALIQLNHSSFDDFVKQLNPNYVIFDRFIAEEQFGWRVAEQAPNAIRVLNTEDLHSLRKTRELLHKVGEDFSLGKWKQQEITKREVASIFRSDLSLLVSTFEMNLLKEHIKIPEFLLMHLPFMMEEIKEENQEDWPSFESRTDFITYGNGKHAPNLDAIKFLEESIWPRIREKLPNANLRVYGAYLPQQINQMHKPKEGFHIMGWVKNLDSEIQNGRIVLAPLRFGAGIKGKITDALKNGTPIITTNLGTEGMSLNLLTSQCFDTEHPKALADSAVALYSDSEKWHKAQKLGIETINGQYSKTKLQMELQNTLQKLGANLVEHRSQNFMGSLLQYQTLAATKFMGKWIEEKNK
ncbi:glycosyltransferase [Flagellimonas sp.]|uniref:glycosyltransferase n=1 Tax=Flagellimonas sp. TaxID=2058762 RepID=UPI003F4A4755